MKKIRLSNRILVVGAILSLTFFLFLIDMFKTYRSTSTVLVLAKSQVAAQQQNQIVENIAQFPKTLSFYERLLEKNPDVRDFTSGLGDKKRKDLWNSILSIERIGEGSSLIKISITSKRESDADQLVKKTTRNMLDFSANYYDIKNDIDLRIIEGSISHSKISGWFWLLLTSLVAGFGFAFVLQYFFKLTKKNFISESRMFRGNIWPDFKKEKSVESEISSLEELYQAEESQATFAFDKKTKDVFDGNEYLTQSVEVSPQVVEMKKITKMIEPDKYPNFPEMPVRPKQQASAPDNLPIGEDPFLFQYNMNVPESIDQKKEEEQSEQKNELKREPTEEELKKRLNQLLKGDI